LVKGAVKDLDAFRRSSRAFRVYTLAGFNGGLDVIVVKLVKSVV
jgi:hypothetical protein